MKIEALHRFDNPEYAEEWSAKFHPTPERLRLFNLILEETAAGEGESLEIL